MEYTDKHKAFLQVFVQEGILSSDDARAIAVKIFNNNNSVSTHALLINIQLQILNMSLKSVKCEHTGEEYWMLVSSILDDSTKFQLEFNHAQLELLRKIYSEIITSDAKGVSGTVCLNMCSNLENKITKHDAEEFLSEMVLRKWLYLSNGVYYMGARSIGELLLYFKCTYEDSLTNCVLCKHVIFHGHTCQECHSVFHNYCLLNYAKIQKPLKCPSCSKPMPDVEIDDSQGPEEANFIGNGNSDDSDDSEEEVPQVKKRRSRHL